MVVKCMYMHMDDIKLKMYMHINDIRLVYLLGTLAQDDYIELSLIKSTRNVIFSKTLVSINIGNILLIIKSD